MPERGAPQATNEERIRNLQGLLKWSAQYDSGNGSEAVQSDIDPERKEYLNEVLNSLGSNAVDEMNRIFRVMSMNVSDEEIANNGQAADELNNVKVEALESLQDLIEDIDNATDFVKVGGATVCDQALDHPHEQIAFMAITCLASAAQNNPSVQEDLVRIGILDKFVKMLSSDSSSGILKEKLLRGISAIVGGHAGICERFVRNKGALLINNTLAHPGASDTLRTRGAYLVCLLAQDFMPFRNVVAVTGVLDQLVKNLGATEDDAVWEQTLRALVICTKESPKPWSHLVESTDLFRKLEDRARKNANRYLNDCEALLEEINYASLLKNKPEHNTSHPIVEPTLAIKDASQSSVVAVGDVDSASAPNNQSNKEFVATSEWQTVQPGQHIPKGLEVNVDMGSGLTKARLSSN